ncbi:hypothetical protein [Klebsiella aerogenes]
MLVQGLLCMQSWSHTSSPFYLLTCRLLLTGAFAIFCGAARKRLLLWRCTFCSVVLHYC